MKKQNNLYCLDIIPYFSELVSRKERLYKIVDLIYKGNEIEYDRYGKKSEFYNNPFGTRGGIKQTKYYNRVVAIISDPDKGKDNMRVLIEELKNEFSYLYDAMAVRKIKKLSEYVYEFNRKYDGRNMFINDLNDNMLMFIIFSIHLEIECDGADQYIQYFIKMSHERMNIINKKSCIKIDKEDLKILNKRYQEMDEKLDFTVSAFLKIYNPYDDEKINKDWVIRYVAGLISLLDKQKLDLDNVVDKLLTQKEIIELMHICYCINEEDFYDDEKLSLWLIAAGQISYLAKAYNEAKKFINENDNEDLINELRIEKDNYNNIRNKLIAQEKIMYDLGEENKKLYKENERLKSEVEELKNS